MIALILVQHITWKTFWKANYPMQVLLSSLKHSLTDYCLTTILKNAEKTGSRCSATVPGFLSNSDQFCAESMKRLRRKGFAFDRLITPTLKVAGSNPVGRTKNHLKRIV